ncbi:Abi family protein [Acinetobacter sp. NEB 394]|jgi:hypothetical protein|uniref:Abi family protein n=1 Tax=Acinetobacter sp. NEB 394 TaxID=2743575 RepID=UPI001C3F3B92|nr:Abi family protein [Acinetobacter sp. NEB 394]
MSLVDAISSPRLNTYKTSFNCNFDNDALKYYYWNQAISAEIYVLLHNIEICLRNRIHTALSLNISELNNDTLSDNYKWYEFFDFNVPDKDDPTKMVLGETGKVVASAKRKLSQKRMRKTPQNVISNIDFGAWRHIFQISHCKNGEVIEWDKINPKIFVHYGDIRNREKRKVVMDRLREIGLLRNRVAHLEPVWKFKERKIGNRVIAEPSSPTQIFSNLNQEIAATVRFLGWLCTDTYSFYIKTKSYKNLQKLIQHQTIQDFGL